jgi:hypothetical protein
MIMKQFILTLFIMAASFMTAAAQNGERRLVRPNMNANRRMERMEIRRIRRMERRHHRHRRQRIVYLLNPANMQHVQAFVYRIEENTAA